MFTDKTLLITGGTGSFGGAVLKRFLDSDLKEIRIFSRDERKQEDLRIGLNNDKLKFFIGDVRDFASVDSAMVGVDFVFHAAALKQVPSCEFYPMEAIKTNVIGTENVLTSAINQNVSKVICLSTDKAVYPINAMGQSKALMEKIMMAKSRGEISTILCATRYGNVMASRGSVIPLFVNQIKNNISLTITDPKMTRYLMSLEESLDLVLHAFKEGKSGDIFVKKSPAASMEVLADAIREVFKSKAKIKIIGTRHGEKLYETLISREEMSKVEDMDKYFRIPSDNRDLNYSKYFTDGEKSITETEDYTSHNTKQLNVEETVSVLNKLDFIKETLNV